MTEWFYTWRILYFIIVHSVIIAILHTLYFFQIHGFHLNTWITAAFGLRWALEQQHQHQENRKHLVGYHYSSKDHIWKKYRFVIMRNYSRGALMQICKTDVKVQKLRASLGGNLNFTSNFR